jgi:hypothetical protein
MKGTHLIYFKAYKREVEKYRRALTITPGSSVGIATDYRLEGPGIESR